ncbi:MAG: glycerol-3-phosphate dehydrogenase (NAD(P)+) [Alteromonadaceae bacterium]|jgi:glycerol-3-phosphate dehydrogenase (NAD(P)+)
MANSHSADITILGAGSYGTALAMCFSRNGTKTLLWGRSPDHLTEMTQDRANQRYLPELPFPDSLIIEADLETAVRASPNILVVVPSHAFADMLKQIQPFLADDARVLWATKGLEPETGRLLQEVALEIIGDQIPLAALSGPTFAKEMAQGLPTAISLASNDPGFTQIISNLLHCEKSFRVYSNDDFIGVQLGGAVKNVIAIGAGIADGIGFGANARVALITRGMAELCRLGHAIGAKQETFMGMAGLGDLVLTCTDNLSRNRRFGLALGKGESVQGAIEGIGQVVEGYRNTKEVYLLAQRMGVEMPITEQIFAVLYQGKSPKEAAMNLLGREKRAE